MTGQWIPVAMMVMTMFVGGRGEEGSDTGGGGVGGVMAAWTGMTDGPRGAAADGTLMARRPQNLCRSKKVTLLGASWRFSDVVLLLSTSVLVTFCCFLTQFPTYMPSSFSSSALPHAPRSFSSTSSFSLVDFSYRVLCSRLY